MYEVFKNVFYFPLRKTLVKVSGSNYISEAKQIVDNIPEVDYYDDNGVVYHTNSVKLPCSIQIYPTSNCNLRCKYCFNDCGYVEGRNLNVNKAKSFIYQVIRNLYIIKSINGKCNAFDLTMCGGGEPTYDWTLFTEIVDYAASLVKKYNIPKKFQLTSNLFISNKKNLDYIIENFEHVHISTDGYEEIQNFQRPSFNEKPSYPIVSKAIKYVSEGMSKKNALCGLRATVSSKYVDKMSDIVEFVHEEYPFVKYIQFEPLNWVRKTERVECISPPDVKDFAENLIKAHGLCTKYNINMSSCFGDINYIRKKGSFCDAVLGHCLMLNYDGDILNCSEASNDNKRTYEKFLIGHIDDENHIEWFNTPITEKNCNDKCQKCFAWYTCGGGCLHSVLDYERNRQFRCELSRASVLASLNEVINERYSAVGLSVKKSSYCESNVIVYSW